MIRLAAQTGYAGIDFKIRETAALAAAHGIAYVRDLFVAANVQPGLWGLPVTWNKEEATWRQDVAELPKPAQMGVELGCRRSAT